MTASPTSQVRPASAAIASRSGQAAASPSGSTAMGCGVTTVAARPRRGNGSPWIWMDGRRGMVRAGRRAGLRGSAVVGAGSGLGVGVVDAGTGAGGVVAPPTGAASSAGAPAGSIDASAAPAGSSTVAASSTAGAPTPPRLPSCASAMARGSPRSTGTASTPTLCNSPAMPLVSRSRYSSGWSPAVRGRPATRNSTWGRIARPPATRASKCARRRAAKRAAPGGRGRSPGTSQPGCGGSSGTISMANAACARAALSRRPTRTHAARSISRESPPRPVHPGGRMDSATPSRPSANRARTLPGVDCAWYRAGVSRTKRRQRAAFAGTSVATAASTPSGRRKPSGSLAASGSGGSSPRPWSDRRRTAPAATQA